MYLMPIPVPIFVDGDKRLVQTDWKRALRLLRDSMEERYGEIVVAGPWLPIDHPVAKEQTLEIIDADERIRLEPVIDQRVRPRAFWLKELGRYRHRMAELVAQARVVHTSVNDPFRPLLEIPLAMAMRRKLPTVLVQDMDSILQIRALSEHANLRRKAFVEVFTRALERSVRAAAARADLSLLKGKALMGRYARFARNPHEFHDTSYLTSEMAPESDVERRVATLTNGEKRPLRLVYCGRLVARKGVTRAVDLVARARARGADVSFEVIGNGPEEAALRDQVAAAGVGSAVNLAGSAPYGPPLLRRLATFDAILFTPTAEDTPRMIFDGYAAGLPLVADGIPYVREREAEEGAAVVLKSDADEAAGQLIALAADRTKLVGLTRAAVKAGRYHSADAWYRRRADWTHEAIARRS
jgi:glycosyltransferase involved in cell wall biosynthesis